MLDVRPLFFSRKHFELYQCALSAAVPAAVFSTVAIEARLNLTRAAFRLGTACDFFSTCSLANSAAGGAA